MDHKILFDTDTAGDAADREVTGQAALAAGSYNQTFEDLDAFFAAFADFLVHADSVAAAYIDDGFLHVPGLDLFYNTRHNR
jgi:hypothetical protein